MTVRTPPGVINTEATDSAVQRDVHRSILGGTLGSFAGGVSATNNAAHGVCAVGDLEVSQSGTPGMSVDVAAGSAFITGTVSALQGPYNLVNDAAVTLAIADADTSDDRHDLVIAQIRDDDYDSSGFRDARLTVVTGTPDPAPSDPSLSAHPNALVLARVVVQANASSITDGDITNLAPRAGYHALNTLSPTDISSGLTFTAATGWDTTVVEHAVRVGPFLVLRVSARRTGSSLGSGNVANTQVGTLSGTGATGSGPSLQPLASTNSGAAAGYFAASTGVVSVGWAAAEIATSGSIDLSGIVLIDPS